jgi:hypothetical protein
MISIWIGGGPAISPGSHHRRLRSANESEYKRDNQENDGYPEEKACAFHSRACNAAETKKSCDQCDDQENYGPV